MANVVRRERDFEEVVLKSEIPVVVDFWAPWCAPCQALNPILEELERNYQGRVRFARLNVEENPKIPARFGVRSLPSIFVFKNGVVVANLVGAVSKENLQKLVESWIG